MTDIIKNHSAASVASNYVDDVVVGLDQDFLAVKEQLCGESSRLTVVPIVGIGGVGKTTLARKAYHDPLIREVFYIGGWVTVSQSYSVEEITSRLQHSLKHFDTDVSELDSSTDVSELDSSTDASELEGAGTDDESHERDAGADLNSKSYEDDAGDEFYRESDEAAAKMTKGAFKKRPEESRDVQMYKTLKGRRYPIVMDDIWSTKVWDDLKKLFPEDGNGSRVMVTTRRLMRLM